MASNISTSITTPIPSSKNRPNTKYVIVHCKHEGCYDMKNILDYENGKKYTPVILNPPKIFLFDDKEAAYDFFDQYMNDVDVIDERCKRGEEVEHIDFCTCGIIDMDENDRPILFYNKLNQIYLLEYGATMFTIPQSVKIDIHNMNVTHRLIRKCKNMASVQRRKYIELGRMCQECEDEDDKKSDKSD